MTKKKKIVTEEDFLRKQNRARFSFNQVDFIRDLCKYEDQAVALIKPFDIRDIDPSLIKCRGDHITNSLWDYYRFVISSVPQKTFVTKGRIERYLVVDKTSGGLLGIIGLTDKAQNDKFLEEFLGWDVQDQVPLTPYSSKNSLKSRGMHTIVQLKRNLPIYEFGQYTGGKLFTLLSMSKPLIRNLEIKYSFKMTAMVVKSMKAKSSTYNRMTPNGLQYLGVDVKDGVYFAELRKKGLRWLRGDTDDLGSISTMDYGEAVEHWKERWMEQRIAHIGTSWVEPDPERYRLSSKMLKL